MKKNAGVLLLIIGLIIIVGILFYLFSSTPNSNRSKPNQQNTPVGDSVLNQNAPTLPPHELDWAVFVVDTKNSNITWSASRIVGASHTGTVPIKYEIGFDVKLKAVTKK